MSETDNLKQKGQRSVLRDRAYNEDQAALDEQTVLQNVTTPDTKAKAFENTDSIASEHDDIVANPLLGIKNQKLLQNPAPEKILGEDVNAVNVEDVRASNLSQTQIENTEILSTLVNTSALDERALSGQTGTTTDNDALLNSFLENILGGNDFSLSTSNLVLNNTQIQNLSTQRAAAAARILPQTDIPDTDTTTDTQTPPPEDDNEDDNEDDSGDDTANDDDNTGDNDTDDDAGNDNSGNDDTGDDSTGNDDATDDGNNGHGNDPDGVDDSNPGQGQGGPNAGNNGENENAGNNGNNGNSNGNGNGNQDTTDDDGNTDTDPQNPTDENTDDENTGGSDDQTNDETDDGNNGHGNDPDGVDDSNPGQGQGGPNAGNNGENENAGNNGNNGNNGNSNGNGNGNGNSNEGQETTNGGTPETPAPQPLNTPVQIRVSNNTLNQDTIDSTYGFDLKPYTYGQTYTVTGAEMNIPGVSANAKITYIFHNENTVTVTLDTAWNSIKNIEVFSDINANITLNNFVHTDVNLGEGGNSTLIINGAKRGNITTASGDDVVEINAQTNNEQWGNNFNIDTGAGNDAINVKGDKGLTGFNIDAGADNDTVFVGGSYKTSNTHLGAGDDGFTGGSGIDYVDGGTGKDTINTGSGVDTIVSGPGNDILTGGAGKDTYVITSQDGNVVIRDFGGVGAGGSGKSTMLPSHDTIKLVGEGLTAKNMLLNYDGKNTTVTFEGVQNFSITLENFDFTNLDNLPAVKGWNILFNAQTQGTDAYDVFNDHGTSQHTLWNKNTVTHLNNANNVVNGKDGSDDVINGMGGDDVIFGGTGNDILRGQEGNDRLIGQGGNDILNGGTGTDTAVFSGLFSEYTFTFNPNGSITVTDTVANRDGVDTLYEMEFIEFRDGVLPATPQSLILPAAGEETQDTPPEDTDDQETNNPPADDIGDDTDNPADENTGESGDQIDDNNNGHGNDPDGVDDSNPGQGQGGPNAGNNGQNENAGNNGNNGNNANNGNSNGAEETTNEDTTNGNTNNQNNNTGNNTAATPIIELVSVNDWYNPNWGGGYNATFKLTLTESMVIDNTVNAWSLDVGFHNPQGTISTGWLDSFNGTVLFDPSTGIFTNAAQDYKPTLQAGDTIQFSVQVQNTGFNIDDFDFSFSDLDTPIQTQDTATQIPETNDASTPPQIKDTQTPVEDVVNVDEGNQEPADDDGNNGHGNDADGIDDSNPGQGQGGPNADKTASETATDDGNNGHGNDIGHVDPSNPGHGPANTGSSTTTTTEQPQTQGVTLNGGNGKDTLIGTDGNDVIYGGNGKDDLTGGKGNDTLYGGNGKNTAHYSGNFSEYSISKNTDGSFTIKDMIANRDGTDTVHEVELFQFHDSLQDTGSQSWLSAVNQTQATPGVSLSSSLSAQSWLTNVEAAHTGETGNNDNNNSQAHGSESDQTQVVNIQDLMQTQNDTNHDSSGSGLL